MKKTTIFSMLSLMHKLMLAGQLLFIAVFYFLVNKGILAPVAKEHEKILQVLALLITSTTLIVGNKLFKNKLADIDAQLSADAKAKLDMYRSASVLYWGLSEMGSLFSGICFMLTGNYAFLALAALVIVYFGMLSPVKQKIATQLNISVSDLDEL